MCAITQTNKHQRLGDCIYQNLRGEDVETIMNYLSFNLLNLLKNRHES